MHHMQEKRDGHMIAKDEDGNQYHVLPTEKKCRSCHQPLTKGVICNIVDPKWKTLTVKFNNEDIKSYLDNVEFYYCDTASCKRCGLYEREYKGNDRQNGFLGIFTITTSSITRSMYAFNRDMDNRRIPFKSYLVAKKITHDMMIDEVLKFKDEMDVKSEIVPYIKGMALTFGEWQRVKL